MSNQKAVFMTKGAIPSFAIVSRKNAELSASFQYLCLFFVEFRS